MKGSRSIVRKAGRLLTMALATAGMPLLVLLSGEASATECECPQPPGGGVQCDSSQVAYCAVRGDVCLTKCTSLSSILGRSDQSIRLLESVGVDGSTIQALEMDPDDVLAERVKALNQVDDASGSRVELILSNGDRATVDGSHSAQFKRALGEF
jgi:hypothetical protein